MEFSIRPPTLQDAQETLELMIRSDVAEYGTPDTDLEDLLHEWGRINLEQDAWLAFDPKGDLAGYAAVLPWGADIRYEFYSDPEWAGANLGRALLARCEERGPSFAAERGSPAEIKARTFIGHVNERDRRIVEEAGFGPGKFYFQMEVDLASPPPAPQWPAGISVRAAVSGRDERAIYELIEAAFDRPGRSRTSFEEWQEHMMRADIYEPGLWFLAMAGQEIAGVCLSFAYPTGGWVRQLGVAEAWRRRGIGMALLRHTFGEFRKRGFGNVGLSVESERPDAHLFYQQVGMRQARQFDEYVKGIKAG